LDLRDSKSLVDVALGRRKADLLVKDGRLVNVFTGEILEHTGVAVKNGRIALVGDVEEIQCDRSSTMNAKGYYLVPGLIDGHVHIESSMLTLTQFARTVLPRGTTTVMIDPHEIGNVLGLKGVQLMLNEARKLPLKVFVQVPSCVPSAPDLETTGATINVSDVKKAMTWKSVIGLGEVMNYRGVLEKSWKLLREIEETEKAGKTVEGHAPKLTEAQLNAYTSCGVEGNHEATTGEEALQNLRLGIGLEVREGSTMKDLKGLMKMLLKAKVDLRHCLLVSDDRSATDLVKEGHMDHIVRRAIEEGVDPIQALQMATINPAEHFKVSKEVGIIAPGRIADILIVKRIEEMKAEKVIANGSLLAENGIPNVNIGNPKYPTYAKKTVHTRRALSTADFDIKSPKAGGPIKALIINVVKGGSFTEKLVHTLKAKDGLLEADPSDDILKISVVERHKGTGNVGKGFVKGFGMKKGAIASTFGHDAHNIVVLGIRSGDMAFAANVVSDMDGGLVAVESGHVLAKLSLPIAGLMSDRPADEVASKLEALDRSAEKLGATVDKPFTVLSFMPLAVIPELRVTDKGLVDVTKFSLTNIMIPD
jgi:adenine deaminase